MSSPLRIIFAGTPEFSVPPLLALLGSGHRVAAVYTQPDRPAGRGRRLTSSPVKEVAQAHGLPLYQPESLRDRGVQGQLAALAADLMVVVAYGLILPRPVLAAPRLGCVNIHASLLPRWRGAAPIQRALLAGDPETGITIMQMEAGLDTGPMIHRRRCPILAGDTGGSLHDRLAPLGAQALLEALPAIAGGAPPLEPQDGALATYAHKLSKAEALIDWQRPALDLERQVRAFLPWPVAQARYAGMVLRIWGAETRPGTAAPGAVVAAGKEGIDVGTGEGLLRITRLQLPGKRVTEAADLVNARDLGGVVLG
jgi:methionyl-tRNA formyltransferase